MIKNAIALFVLLSSSVFACEVVLPEHLVVLGGDNGAAPIETKDCADQLSIDLRQILTDVEGKITAGQIGEMLTQKGHTTFTIRPYLVHVKQLKSLIRDQLNLPTGIQVKTTNGVNTANFISLAAGDMIEVECPSCLYGTQQPIKLSIKGFDGIVRNFMAAADFKKMVRAYRVTVPVNSFSEINPLEVLTEVYIESIPHTDLVTNLELVKFYKTNKPIRPGELLKHSDLNAINLVKAGIKTDVIIESAMVRIKTQGISRSNGTLGEQVEVWHQQKNKKYLGKVIDLNKILVEL